MRKKSSLVGRTIINIILIIFNLWAGGFVFFLNLLYLGDLPQKRQPSVIVETEYGDTFTIVYINRTSFLDSCRQCCIVKDNDSNFRIEYEFSHDIKEKDIVGLYCDSDLRIYEITGEFPKEQLWQGIIYNDGTGFKEFNRINSNPKVKEILEQEGKEKCLQK